MAEEERRCLEETCNRITQSAPLSYYFDGAALARSRARARASFFLRLRNATPIGATPVGATPAIGADDVDDEPEEEGTGEAAEDASAGTSKEADAVAT